MLIPIRHAAILDFTMKVRREAYSELYWHICLNADCDTATIVRSGRPNKEIKLLGDSGLLPLCS